MSLWSGPAGPVPVGPVGPVLVRSGQSGSCGWVGGSLLTDGKRDQKETISFGTNEHPGRDTDVTLTQSKALTEILNFRSVL